MVTGPTREHWAALEAEFIDSQVEWQVPLGDNWLWTWTWAANLERDHGIDARRSIRAAYDRYFEARQLPRPMSRRPEP